MAKTSNVTLSKPVSFAASDLDLNRRLILTDEQMKKLNPTVKFYIFLSVSGAVIFFCLSASILLTSTIYPLPFIWKLLSAGGFGVFFYWAFWSLFLNKQIRKNQGVKYVEGQPVFNISYISDLSNNDSEINIPIYSMKIKGVRFYLDEKTFDSISGNEIRVYYFPTLKKKILSFEILD